MSTRDSGDHSGTIGRGDSVVRQGFRNYDPDAINYESDFDETEPVVHDDMYK